MRRQETTYMAMGGQEYALLPVTAMELVRAGAETGALLAGDAPERTGDRELIFSAAIVAAGAHRDGRRAFSGPEEVLETLTADFIMRCDVDANGKVESADARSILRASVNLEPIRLNDCDHQETAWESITLSDGTPASYHRAVCAKCGEVLFAEHKYEL